MTKVIIITLVPVGIGMLIRSKAPKFWDKMNKPVKVISGILLVVII
ncbi:MAG: hypothetical protein PHT92_07655 [Bacteroidales bacterium]|nr:hypothetical protein [Bacteroidales bacterium]